jgi:hypothetical protein
MIPQANHAPNLGLPVEHEIGGKAYKFSLITQAVKAGLEQKLTNKAKALLKSEKAQMSDDEYKLAYEAHAEAVVSGKYSFGSKVMQNFLATPSGIATLLSICSNQPVEHWEGVLLEEPLECSIAIKMLLDQSFPSLKKIQQEADQNA